MYRMYGTPRAQGSAGAVPLSFARCLAQGCAGAVPLSFAQRFSISMGAKVAWSTVSGHAVNPWPRPASRPVPGLTSSMGARARLPVSHGPETVDHTPSAMWMFRQRLILTTQLIPTQPISWPKIILQPCLNRTGFGLVVITPSHQGRK